MTQDNSEDASIGRLSALFHSCRNHYELPTKSIIYIRRSRLTLRSHSSLHSHTPFQAHFDSHVASDLARLQTRARETRQTRISEFERHRNPNDRIRIGDKVLLRTKPRSFQKLSSVFNPHFSDRVYSVRSIDKRVLPWLYRLKEISDGRRKFYSFELQKLDEEYGAIQSERVNPSNILVKDVIMEGNTRLRSGKTFQNRGTPFYLIEREGRSDRIPEGTLKILKNSLGKEAITYDGSFYESESKRKFII